MAANPSLAELVLRLGFLFAYALLFACVEIEIEGPHGWAERLPTWFRITTPYARAFGTFMRGKPITGYHATMFLLSFWSFHIGFVGGVPWSWAAEATTLSAYVAWVVVWDLLWFVLNPRFGWGRFRKVEIWWHSGRWIGRFPIDYYNAALASVAVAASARLTTGSFLVLAQHIALLAGWAALVALSVLVAPAYMRWYAYMRRPGTDERHLCVPAFDDEPDDDPDPDNDPSLPRSPGSPDQTTSAASGSKVVR